MNDVIIDVLQDTLPMLPLLFLSYLFVEWYEHRSEKTGKINQLLVKQGPFFGALFGLFPQCGFSVVGATLFVEKKITLGALLAVFISTSDEAVPILLSHPKMFDKMLMILLIKFIVAMLVGYTVDALYKKTKLYEGVYDKKTIDHEEHSHSILLEAIKRTLKIFVYVLVINFILSTALYLVGENKLENLLLSGNVFQPIIAAFIGFIPNCASSIVVSELYVRGVLTFGAMMAGLITNAGVGLMVLLRYRIDWKILWRIIGILLMVALVVAYLCILFKFN